MKKKEKSKYQEELKDIPLSLIGFFAAAVALWALLKHYWYDRKGVRRN